MTTPSNLLTIQRRAGSLVAAAPPSPWQDVPPGALYFHVRNSIVCPDPDTADSVVASYTVPDGFAAVVDRILNLYIGATPPVEGDETQLFFSIRVNRAAFLRDFGTISTTLGSLSAGPYPVPGGIRVHSGDLVEYLATVPAGSPIGTGGTNRLHAHLLGWHYPEVP